MKIARRRVAGRRTLPSPRQEGITQIVATWVNPIARPLLVVLPIFGSAVLFVVCQYLSSRFDVGSPISRHGDPNLTIWISLFAVGGAALIWALAMFDRATRDRSDRLKSSGSRARARLVTRTGSGR